jgi:hypothetical protein
VLKDIVEAVVLDSYRIRLRFEDGVNGVVDVSDLIAFNGVFSPLKDPLVFSMMRVNQDLGTICWPCGADLDPDVLYALVTGSRTPRLERIGESRSAANEH